MRRPYHGMNQQVESPDIGSIVVMVHLLVQLTPPQPRYESPTLHHQLIIASSLLRLVLAGGVRIVKQVRLEH